MTQNPKKIKPDFELKLVDEKRAFVAIMLTSKLTQAAKLVAANCLSHYDSRRGHSYASLPTIAVECGYSAQSTKTIKAALVELQKAGAFTVIQVDGRVYRCIPNIEWFTAEYASLKKQVVNDNLTPGSQPYVDDMTPGSEPYHPGFTTLPPRVHNPTTPGSEPYEEDSKEKNQREENQSKKKSAAGEREPVIGFDKGQDGSHPKPVNDNGSGNSWPQDFVNHFVDAYVIKTGSRKAITAELYKLKGEGIEFSRIIAGVEEYNRVMKLRGAEGQQYAKQPNKWLEDRCWNQFQPQSQYAKTRARMNVAI